MRWSPPGMTATLPKSLQHNSRISLRETTEFQGRGIGPHKEWNGFLFTETG